MPPTPNATVYRSLALVDLIRRIVDHSDRHALAEFHNHRTIFYGPEGRSLRLAQYLYQLKEQVATWKKIPGNTTVLAEEAYNLTLDKFQNLPVPFDDTDEGTSLSRNHQPAPKTNCRLYFSAFLKHMTGTFKKIPPRDALDEEQRATHALQKLVRHHFFQSLKAAQRNVNPFWNRYNWYISDRQICIWLPIVLEGHQRRQWLESNVPDPDPNRPGERNRIQAIVDRELVHLVAIPFEDDRLPDGQAPTPLDLLEQRQQSPFGPSLATTVAQEKTDRIVEQRPAIRALGKARLKTMILEIFSGIADEDYQDQQVAHAFGLSKATFSRFAGSNWYASKSKKVPDLWRNTAHLVASHQEFQAVVQQSGYGQHLAATLNPPN